jgi:DNA-directed RNA polymerase specialized sigma24 family protein
MTWLSIACSWLAALLVAVVIRLLRRRGAPGAARAAVAAPATGVRPSWPVDDVTAVNAMLAHIGRHDQRLAKVVLLRWIGGLSLPVVAATLGVPVATVERDLQLARALLHSEATPGAAWQGRDGAPGRD